MIALVLPWPRPGALRRLDLRGPGVFLMHVRGQAGSFPLHQMGSKAVAAWLSP